MALTDEQVIKMVKACEYQRQLLIPSPRQKEVGSRKKELVIKFKNVTKVICDRVLQM